MQVIRHLAEYNAWANERLYAACGELTPEERKRAVGASFASIHGTLNHLLLADRVWLGRFRGVPYPVADLWEEVCPEFEDLRRERVSTDQDLKLWAAGVDDASMAEPLTFTTITKARELTMPLGHAALHLFNHHAYHRGQVASLIRQLGHKPPETDLLCMSI
jgi:uncharacterized damage-inducible protein DinB